MSSAANGGEMKRGSLAALSEVGVAVAVCPDDVDELGVEQGVAASSVAASCTMVAGELVGVVLAAAPVAVAGGSGAPPCTR
jgi:hypothetical protein